MTDGAAPAPSPSSRPHEPSHIGPRLRAQREQLGLSLRELARRIGVSASLISQIERDKVNPSVSTLYALVRELGLGMGDLFATDGTLAGPLPSARAADAARHPRPPRADQPRLRRHLGAAHRRRATRASSSSASSTTSAASPCPEDSLVRHGGKEYGYVISGRLGVRIGFDAYDLGPGDSISFDSSSPHRLWTIGDRPAEAIWVVVGRQSDSRVARA